MVQNGSQIDLRLTSRMTLQDPPSDWSPDTLRSLISRPQISRPQNKGLFDTFISFADIEQEPSKDWIRPPSQSQEYGTGR